MLIAVALLHSKEKPIAVGLSDTLCFSVMTFHGGHFSRFQLRICLTLNMWRLDK